MNSMRSTFPVKVFSSIFFPLFFLFIIIFWMLIESESENEIEFRSIEQKHLALLAKEVAEHRFQEIKNDIITQSNHHELRLFFRRDREKELKSFAGELTRFLEVKGVYDQARLIDLEGREKLRINFTKEKAVLVPQNELQYKGDRYYFQEAIKYDKGMVYISRFDLNMEKGEIEIPYKPAIRFATPVFDEEGEKRGLFILNYSGQFLIEHIKAIFKHKISLPLLVNKEGYFLMGLKTDQEWGFMFSNGKKNTFEQVYPRAWKKIWSEDSGNYLNDEGLFTFNTIGFKEDQNKSTLVDSQKSDENNLLPWKFISFIPRDTLDLTRGAVFLRHSSVLFFLLPVLFILSWMLAVTTERKRKEEEKQLESRKILQAILDTLPESVFWKDKNLNYLGCNRSFALDSGYKNPDDLIGKSDSHVNWKKETQLHPSDDMEILERGIEKLNFEEAQTSGEGKKRWIEMSKRPLMDLKGNVYGILGTYRDITKRKVKALQSTIFKDNLINLLQTPFISIKSNYAIITKIAALSLNVERVSIWIYDDEKTAIVCQDLYIIGKDSHENGLVLYEKDFPGYFNALKRNRPIVADDALTHEDTCEFSEVYLKPNGISSMIDVPVWHKGIIRGVLCCEHCGEKRVWQEEEIEFLVNLAFIVAQTMDAHERVKLQERRAELISELEYANKELGDFAYIVSHDLKAPLRGIAALANWLQTDYGDKFDEEGREHLKLLSGRVERMNNLINGILKYSRAGRLKTVTEKVDLNVVIKEIIDSLSPPEHIQIEMKESFPVIYCDWTLIVQIFQNLLSNAIKYMDKENGIIKLDCEEKDKYWLFSVTDNGPGIEEKYFEKIFHIFQTLSPRDSVESTGVGLSIVRKVVEMYNGKIWVESKEGKGSTFYFTLPLTMKLRTEGQNEEQ